MRAAQVGAVIKDLEIAWRPSLKTPKCSVVKTVGPMTCDFRPGKFNCVIGPSGCGKTTLMNMLCGHQSRHQKIKNGSILAYDDTDTETTYANFTAYRKVTGNQIRFVPSVDVFPTSMRVEDILRCSVQLQSGSVTAESQRVVATIASWLHLDQVLGMRLETLTSEAEASRGERKRISIAKELCSAKNGQLACLCLDEPTLNLDTALSIEMIKLLKTLIRQGSIGTVIATLHQPTPMIFGMIDHMVLMDSQGLVLCQGPPKECMSLLTIHQTKGNWDIFLEYAAHEKTARSLEEKYKASSLANPPATAPLSPPRKTPCCPTSCKDLCKRISSFGREIRILSQFLMRYVMGNVYISIFTPFLSLLGGVFLGLLFRNSFHLHSSTPAPYILPETLADSNSMRTLTWLATSNDTAFDLVRTQGISGTDKEDPFEKLATWPTSYRWIYRTIHSWESLVSLHPFYPEYSYDLWTRNESFVNDYRDLAEFLPESTLAPESGLADETETQDIEQSIVNSLAKKRVLQTDSSADQVYYDSDIPFDDINFFTPSFIYTEIDLALQLVHYSWYQVSWESFQSCMSNKQMASSLSFYLCILSEGMPVLDNYIVASGLPSLYATKSAATQKQIKDSSDPTLNEEREKATTEQAGPKRRRLFLDLDPSLPVFDILRAVSASWAPGSYEFTMNILDNLTNSMSVVASLFFLGAALGFVGMEYFQYFFLLRNCANRDSINGHYGRLTFHIAMNIAHAPLELVSAIAMTLPVCLISGLESKGWVYTILLCWLFVAVMASIHRLLCGLSANVGSAVRVSPLVVMLLVLFSGFFIRSADVPSWIQSWAIYFSPYRWAIFAVCLCYYPNYAYSGPIPNELVYAANGIDTPSIGYCVGVLFIQLIIYRILSSIAFVIFHKEGGLY